MKNNLDKQLLEELCSLYQDYLSECEVYDGASFWSNKRVQEIEKKLVSDILQTVYKEIEQKRPKDKISTGTAGDLVYGVYNKALEDYDSVIKQIMEVRE